jgi:ribokinase
MAATAGVRYAIPALAVSCVDTVGAGDAFAGVFAATVDAGLPLQPSLARACAAGGLACTRAGAQPSLPYANEIAGPSLALESRIDVSLLPPS